MAGLVPAIHDFHVPTRQDVDGRDKPGHDELGLIVDGMDRRRHHSRQPPPRRGACGRRADDARRTAAISGWCAAAARASVVPLLQPGNSVRAVWRARLDEHLGSYHARSDADPRRPADGLGGGELRHADDRRAPAAAARARPASGAAPRARMILDHLDAPAVAGALFVRFELALLAELGFGLDLDNLRRDRSERGPDLRLAEIGPRGLARRRRAMEGAAAVAAGISDRGPGSGDRGRNRCGLRADGLLPRAARVRAARAGNSRLAPGALGRAGAGGGGVIFFTSPPCGGGRRRPRMRAEPARGVGDIRNRNYRRTPALAYGLAPTLPARAEA